MNLYNMRLVMITRKVDSADSLAGFVYNWVKKIGSRVEHLCVITWQKSDRGDLPKNIEVLSLPKNKFLKIFVLQKYLWQFLRQADGIFCHMNPEYTVLSALIAKLFSKRIVTWYTHSAVTFRLKLVEKLANVILTASEKSFRLPSSKVSVVGHGIDTDVFVPDPQRLFGNNFNLVSVGRISPTKDYESMIKAVNILHAKGHNNITLKLVGAPGLAEQQIYYESLQQMVKKMKLEAAVEFVGPLPQQKVIGVLQQSDVLLNLSGTGSLDKAVLEAMSCGCLVLTSNEAFAEMLPEVLKTEKDNPALLAEKILYLMNLKQEEKQQLKVALRNEVVAHHNLDRLVEKIVAQFS